MPARVMVAMSGGVDSNAVAAMLCEMNFHVCGATFQLFCGSDRETRAAMEAAKLIGIEHRVYNFVDEFEKSVVYKFANGYLSGVTPNPCIDCNREIKFGLFFKAAMDGGFDYFATGHYARIERDAKSGRFFLKKAKDSAKDQSYVLYSLSQPILSKVIFPLGNYTKPEIRQYAFDHGIPGSSAPESQDICFIPDGDYASFIEKECALKPAPGDFTDENGEVLGSHKGIHRYTVGQRKGLGISSNKPYYVVGKNAAPNTICLGQEDRLYTKEFAVSGCNWIMPVEEHVSYNVTVRTRYHQTETDAIVTPDENLGANVVLAVPQRAVAPGQAAVFYIGDCVFGGGTICRL